MPVWNKTFRDFAFNKEEQFITSSDGHDFWKLFQTAVLFRCGEFLTYGKNMRKNVDPSTLLLPSM